MLAGPARVVLLGAMPGIQMPPVQMRRRAWRGRHPRHRIRVARVPARVGILARAVTKAGIVSGTSPKRPRGNLAGSRLLSPGRAGVILSRKRRRNGRSTPRGREDSTRTSTRLTLPVTLDDRLALSLTLN